jgi:hypothetical protein
MVLSVPLNTYNALVDAPRRGIVPRDFVFIRAKNRETEEIEEIGLWNGPISISALVVRPNDGEDESRTFQNMAGLMQVPAIPMSMKLEVRSIKLVFSNLSPAVINAVLVYNAKGRPVQIHRGLLDPSTRNLVDPATCRFDGYVNQVRIKRAKAGNDGLITMECQSHARQLAMGSAQKFSNEFFEERGAEQPFLNIVPKIVWGQKDLVHERNGRRGVKWIK